jgi:hypothetical protein
MSSPSHVGGETRIPEVARQRATDPARDREGTLFAVRVTMPPLLGRAGGAPGKCWLLRAEVRLFLAAFRIVVAAMATVEATG